MRHYLSCFDLGALVTPLCFLAACTGSVDAPAPGQSAAGGPTSSSGGSAATGGATSSAPLDCSQVHPGPARARRLNRFEYDNTVRDLLGDTTHPARKFPTEERSRLGLDNDANALTISPVLVEQYQQAAESLAATAVSQMASLLPCAPQQAGEEACGKSFITAFGEKAFRRPLEADESERLWRVLDAGRTSESFTAGVRMVIEAVLQSPAFLYRVELGAMPAAAGAPVRLSSFEMASRLSYFFWQSMPDDALRAAAAAGSLAQDDAIAAQAARLLADPRAREMTGHFHEAWLHLDRYATLEKDTQIFSAFTPEIPALFAEETRQFLDHWLWDGEGDVASLFTAPYTFMNQKLAAYYGVTGPSSDAFARVELAPEQRQGLLGQGGLLAVLAKANQTGPVQRGKFVREQFFCQDIPPPPAGVVIKAPDLSPTLSTRERFGQHSQDPTCQGCHGLMDPIGLSLESIDGSGRYRGMENGKAIDVSGEVLQTDVPGTFSGLPGLAQKLASSAQVKTCLARAWFQYAYGRAQTDEDSCTLAKLDQRFAASGYKLKDLLVALTETDAFRYRSSTPAGGMP
ncbi:MAG TPA: DUF1592 domain-containing protein [Polyangiaceae bacterium]|nr:DUF1592 domain-containing protein [Polyangiaceae bacterium]